MVPNSIDQLIQEVESQATELSKDEKVYKIVMVDDIKSISSSMKRELTFVSRKLDNVKLSIVDIQDPEIAYEYLQKCKPDLLISDVKMPYLTGDKLVEAVKKLYPDLPVIVVTGFATKENILSVYKSDKNSIILSKPWEPERLVGAVNQMLGTNFQWND
ncbi:response regulator [Leptospira meyeri]|uniref:Response regulator receiver domain-containing protein n=1 Tax=Leptospira meyeri TaxID=29508 RepID=A0A4R8MKV2_LEPME|nr:response regulator [Leptospira meyeri]EKJ87882.1 response regulator receiver domain protein [Leptospira meyeri serovar Hardjo str. Went 5]EMJ90057.1 response regulator receiver domain protein [Leptospira meyeri serovar Semaranga str. Veldrot Semarang 173]TDY67912.1 response regulator receiver domain-containing protein [Leptospira meyeri]TGL52193.1 response regulator [Leptospira meyeri]